MTPLRSDSRLEPKACAQCFKAKVKCTWDGPPGNTCTRCTRLHKDCRLRAAPHASNIRASSVAGEQGPSDDPRIAGLESRIDLLTRRLPSPERSISHGGAFISPAIADVDQAITQLSLYRQHLAPLFPFVPIPAVPLEQLSAEHPLLYRAVIMASFFRNRPEQAKEGARLRQILSHLAFVDGEKSLDLLQALLLLIAFYHVHLTTRSQISILMNLALALLADLGFNRLSDENDRRKLIFDSSRTSYGFNTARTLTTKASNEQRCVLACFYMSSMVSVAFTRVDPMRFTRYIEHLCVVFSETGSAADAYAVRLVQVQALMNRVGETLPLDDLGTSSTPDCSRAPVVMHMDALRESITGFNTSPPMLDTDRAINLKLHRAVASIYLYEVSLFDRAWKAPDSLPSRRVDAAYLCLRSVDDFFTTLLDLRSELLYTQPYVMWTQVAYALLICSRLSLLRFPGWSSTSVKSIIDFPVLLDRLFQKLSQASTIFTSESSDSSTQTSSVGMPDAVLTRTADKILKIKSWFLKHTEGNTTATEPQSDPSGVVNDDIVMGTHYFPDFLTGYGDAELDENFWQVPSQFHDAL